MLSDVDIIQKIKEGEIQLTDPTGRSVIDEQTGRERSPGQLQSHGYDLRIKAVYAWDRPDWLELEDGEKYTLRPGEFVAIKTYERIRLGSNIGATVNAMARKTLLGLSHISTTIHPGWAVAEDKPMYIIVAVGNVGRAPIHLQKGDRFCRLMFHEAINAALLPAPTLEWVQREFEGAKIENRKRYGKKTQYIGWFLLAVSTIIAMIILFLVETYTPQYTKITLPVVVVLLSIALAAIRRRFNVLPGL